MNMRFKFYVDGQLLTLDINDWMKAIFKRRFGQDLNNALAYFNKKGPVSQSLVTLRYKQIIWSAVKAANSKTPKMDKFYEQFNDFPLEKTFKTMLYYLQKKRSPMKIIIIR